MHRNFTAFVATTSDPDAVLANVEDCLGDEYTYEVATPRRDEPDRIRIEGDGWFDDELEAVLEAGTLGPIEWAVVMTAMDEAVGVGASVFDGTEQIDLDYT